MVALIISLIACLTFTLFLEKAESIALGLVRYSAFCLPADFRDQRLEQWESDILNVDGQLWKFVTSLGCVWFVRREILESVVPIKLRKKYIVMVADGDLIHVRWGMTQKGAAALTFGLKKLSEKLLEMRAEMGMDSNVDPTESPPDQVFRIIPCHSLPADLDAFIGDNTNCFDFTFSINPIEDDAGTQRPQCELLLKGRQVSD